MILRNIGENMKLTEAQVRKVVRKIIKEYGGDGWQADDSEYVPEKCQACSPQPCHCAEDHANAVTAEILGDEDTEMTSSSDRNDSEYYDRERERKVFGL